MNYDKLNEIWNHVKIEMKNFIENEVFYNTFFIETKISEIKNNNIIVIVQNDFVKNICEIDLKHKIKSLIINNFNIDYEIIFCTEKEKDLILLNNNNDFESVDFNIRQTFENYIVGEYNKKIYEVGKMILDDNFSYNPLFIYGDTGVGKTHFINSLGLAYINKFKDRKVSFYNSEDFIKKIFSFFENDKNKQNNSSKKIEEFKKSFSNIDLLIIDDIQFLSNKDKTNEIFFNIFNDLIKNNISIIIVSDRSPNDLNIDKRMISRYNSGIIFKIPYPDKDTIINFIEKKIKNFKQKIIFSKNAVLLIANRFNNDIRILDGIMNKILFSLSLENAEGKIINESCIKKILELELNLGLIDNNYKISPNIVIETVCLRYSIPKELVISKSRTKESSFVRKICIYILRNKLNMSYGEIGSFFSNRSHSTILESYKEFCIELENNNDLMNIINDILKVL